MKKTDKIDEHHSLFEVFLKVLGIQLNALEFNEVRQWLLRCCSYFKV
jgi:hypothetical protein